MKRTISILVCILLFTNFCSCSFGVKTPEKQNEKVEFISFAYPLGATSYVYSDISWSSIYNEINQTRFWCKSHLSAPLKLKFADAPISFISRQFGNERHYFINGEEYVCIKQAKIHADLFDFFEWTFDRAFFYEYGTAKEGTRIYKNVNVDTDEVVICVTKYGDELILVKVNSPINTPSEYSINDFGVCVLGGSAFAKAADLSRFLYAHTAGKNAVGESVERFEFATFEDLELVFEYTRIPGLRYGFHVAVNRELYCSRGEQKPAYVYCRQKEMFIPIAAPSEISNDLLWRYLEYMFWTSESTPRSTLTPVLNETEAPVPSPTFTTSGAISLKSASTPTPRARLPNPSRGIR